jgi:hypothetical protein
MKLIKNGYRSPTDLKRHTAICRDCGAKECELHELGCDYERCGKCGGQYITCDCRRKKRVPFFRLYWSCCERCGEPWPEMFIVPNQVWRHYILSLGDGDKMLCLACFKRIVKLTDGGRYMHKHGGEKPSVRMAHLHNGRLVFD